MIYKNMKSNVERLWVKVTYEVDLIDLEIPSEVLEEMDRASFRSIHMGDNRYPNASEWLSQKISESDASEWAVEIEDLITKE